MKGEAMTRKEAKNELRPIKEMEADIKSVMLEIERLDAIRTRMTPTYDANKVSGTMSNKIEEATIKILDYRERLATLTTEKINYMEKCLGKIDLIEPASLRMFLRLYYFDGMTIERISEIIDKTPRWTYELFCSALDEYAKK